MSSLAQAIAYAEGFGRGSAGTALNNPGNLENSNGTLQSFPTLEQGWAALEAQINKYLTGQSAYAGPTTSINDLAQTYTGGDNPEGWANAVSQHLGITPDSTIAQAAQASGNPYTSLSGGLGAIGGAQKGMEQNGLVGGFFAQLLSSRVIIGVLGAGLILIGAIGFDRVQDIVTNAARTGAEVAA